jgi:hypothetical protein
MFYSVSSSALGSTVSFGSLVGLTVSELISTFSIFGAVGLSAFGPLVAAEAGTEIVKIEMAKMIAVVKFVMTIFLILSQCLDGIYRYTSATSKNVSLDQPVSAFFFIFLVNSRNNREKIGCSGAY